MVALAARCFLYLASWHLLLNFFFFYFPLLTKASYWDIPCHAQCSRPLPPAPFCFIFCVCAVLVTAASACHVACEFFTVSDWLAASLGLFTCVAAVHAWSQIVIPLTLEIFTIVGPPHKDIFCFPIYFMHSLFSPEQDCCC